MINKEEFQNFVDQGFTIIPVAKKISLNNASPLNLYSKISNKTNTFLLESVEGGDKWAQYSIIGLDCLDTIKVSGNTIENRVNSSISSFESDNPLEEIKKLTSNDKSPEIDNLPRFYGGYVGFFAYESAQYAEKRIADLVNKESKFKDHMPEIYLVKADKLIVYDNTDQSIRIVFNTNPSNTSYEGALQIIDSIEVMLGNELVGYEDNFNMPKGEITFNSNFLKDDYLDFFY